MDHSEAARCLAKVSAYIRAGRPEKGKEWAEKLIDWWRKEGVIE